MSIDRDKPATVDGVSFRWPGAAEWVLRDFSLEVGRGERLFVRGPSGCGKTTLISLVGGLLLPDSGRITLVDRDLTSLGAAARDRLRADHVGFVFQLFNLVPYLSLVDNVLLACRFSERRRNRVPANAAGTRREQLEAEAVRLLRRLQIPDGLLHRTSASELSVGQQQRVAAARALIGHPELIIADEPTSALDADTRNEFIDLLFEECAASGASLLFVSHDESLAARFDRRIELAGAAAPDLAPRTARARATPGNPGPC